MFYLVVLISLQSQFSTVNTSDLTLLGHTLRIFLRQSDVVELLRVGQHHSVKADSVHGALEIQLYLLPLSPLDTPSDIPASLLHGVGAR